jgi:hypothetical protein
MRTWPGAIGARGACRVQARNRRHRLRRRRVARRLCRLRAGARWLTSAGELRSVVECGGCRDARPGGRDRPRGSCRRCGCAAARTPAGAGRRTHAAVGVAVRVVVGMELGQFLAPVQRHVGGVDVEHQFAGRCLVTASAGPHAACRDRSGLRGRNTVPSRRCASRSRNRRVMRAGSRRSPNTAAATTARVRPMRSSTRRSSIRPPPEHHDVPVPVDDGHHGPDPQRPAARRDLDVLGEVDAQPLRAGRRVGRIEIGRNCLPCWKQEATTHDISRLFIRCRSLSWKMQLRVGCKRLEAPPGQLPAIDAARARALVAYASDVKRFVRMPTIHR